MEHSKILQDLDFMNTTSDVYVKERNGGVFLNIVQNGDGTSLLVYNSLFPMHGFSPLT